MTIFFLFKCLYISQTYVWPWEFSCIESFSYWFIFTINISIFLHLSENQKLNLILSSSGFKPKDSIALHLTRPRLLLCNGHLGYKKREQNNPFSSFPWEDSITDKSMRRPQCSRESRSLPICGQQALCLRCESLQTQESTSELVRRHLSCLYFTGSTIASFYPPKHPCSGLACVINENNMKTWKM